MRSRAVTFGRFFAAALGDLAGPLPQLGDEALHPLAATPEHLVPFHR